MTIIKIIVLALVVIVSIRFGILTYRTFGRMIAASESEEEVREARRLRKIYVALFVLLGIAIALISVYWTT